MPQLSKKAIFFKNFSWSVASEIFLKILSFAFIVVLSRKLGQEGLGLYTYLFSVIAIVNIVWDLGIGSYYNRKWVTSDEDYEHDIRVIGGIRLILGAVSLVILIPYLYFFEHQYLLQLILVSLVYYLDLFKSLPAVYFQARNRFDRIFIINCFERLIYYGVSIIVMLMGQGLTAVLVCFVLSKLVSGTVGNILKFSLYWPTFDKKQLWIAVKQGIPLFFVTFFGVLYFRVDSLMIKYYLGLDWLGAYSAGYRLLDVSTIFTGLVGGATFAIFVGMQSGSKEALSAALTKNIKYVTVVGMFATAVLMGVGRYIIYFIYGSQFAAAHQVLPFLAPTLVFLFLNSVISQQLVASHKERYVLKILVALAALNISLNVLLIPHFGIIGAAISTLICEIINSVLLFIKTNIEINWHWVMPTLAAFLVSITILYNFQVFWMLRIAVAGTVYVLLLWFARVIDIRDFNFFPKQP